MPSQLGVTTKLSWATATDDHRATQPYQSRPLQQHDIAASLQGATATCNSAIERRPLLELALPVASLLAWAVTRTRSFWTAMPNASRSMAIGHHELRSSRSFKNTVRRSGFSGSPGKDSRNFAITVGLVRRKKVLISPSTSRVDMYALLGS